MKTYTAFYILITCIAGLFISPLNGANKYKTISATACDSLIKANEKNPNFVILDVRTPDIWVADHLTGSINRNYYDTDFNAKLDALPKQKIYLLHCQSGGRSGPTLTKMKNLNFAEVYEMSGGINTWKSKSFPTTAKLAPRLLLVSNGGVKKGTIQYGITDTLKITVTNRANDTLKFVSVTVPAGNEFSTNFDLKKKLKGSDDYTFSVFYKPQQINKDSVIVGILSNGGELKLSIILKKGTIQEIRTITRNEPKIYPNPATGFIVFENISWETFQEVSLINQNGQLVKKVLNFPVKDPLNVADLTVGMYFVRIVSGGRTIVEKLIISR
jgi:rhodanese-related sulfurtransferase